MALSLNYSPKTSDLGQMSPSIQSTLLELPSSTPSSSRGKAQHTKCTPTYPLSPVRAGSSKSRGCASVCVPRAQLRASIQQAPWAYQIHPLRWTRGLEPQGPWTQP